MIITTGSQGESMAALSRNGSSYRPLGGRKAEPLRIGGVTHQRQHALSAKLRKTLQIQDRVYQDESQYRGRGGAGDLFPGRRGSAYHLLGMIPQIRDIRDHQIDPQHFILRERQAAVYHNNTVFILEGSNIKTQWRLCLKICWRISSYPDSEARRTYRETEYP